MSEGLIIAKGNDLHLLLPGMANRHGLIAGATGTGKTVTLRVIAENFSSIGVPVFMADVKGDFSGMARPGQENFKINELVPNLRIACFPFAGLPTVISYLYGDVGYHDHTVAS